jgi:enterochelin esterase-like enzyme
MKMSVHVLALAVALAAVASVEAAEQAAPPTANAGIVSGANTTDPSGLFYVDTSGLDFKTSPPTRDPSNPNYPRATELPDGAVPPIDGDGNFIIGSTHLPAAQTFATPGLKSARVISFTMSSADSAIYRPALVRDEQTFNESIRKASAVPGDPSNLLISTSHAGTWKRSVSVYIPHGYVRGSRAPFIVSGDSDGGQNDALLFATLDNLITQHRLPPLIAISIGNGGQDAQGSQRGREYDTVSGTYAEWVESEVLPLVEQSANVRLTRNPDARMAMGFSSSGAAAFSMAWFHPELYHRVLAYSPTMINQQWPHNPALPGGAWEFHSPWPGPTGPKLEVHGFNLPGPTDLDAGAPLIPNSPKKPIRYWFECGDRDLFYPVPAMTDGMHDWVLANENMAKALAAAGYQYQYVFARNAGHVDHATLLQTLPEALEWVWKGFKAPAKGAD